MEKGGGVVSLYYFEDNNETEESHTWQAECALSKILSYSNKKQRNAVVIM